jgi:hypothetical protein
VRAQLRGGAQSEHRGLELVQAEEPSGGEKARVDVSVDAGLRQREREVVRDVEAAEGIGRLRVGRGDQLDGAANTRVEELEPRARRGRLRIPGG